MKPARSSLLVVVGAALAAAACGGSKPATNCGVGTILMGSSCVPDGTSVCGRGTTPDPTTGACVPNANICGPGTVFARGRCAAETEVIAVDAEEKPEPNDAAGKAGAIPLPPAGDDGVLVHGCIDPYADDDGDGGLDPDYDSWRITVTGPTLLEVTADGVNGLAGAFQVLPNDDALERDVWRREAFNLLGDTSSRQLFLPKAGDYDIVMADSRSFLARFYTEAIVATGGPTACYYATVKQIEPPATMPLPLSQVMTDTGHAVRVYGFAAADGDILTAQAETPQHSTTSAALTLLVNGQYVRSDWDAFTKGPAQIFRGNLRAADQVVLVADTRFDFSDGRAPAEMRMLAGRLVPTPLSATGAASVTNTGRAFASLADTHLFPFDVPAHAIVYSDFSFSVPSNSLVLDVDGQVVAQDPAASGGLGETCCTTTALSLPIRYPAPGRYYLAVYTPNAAAGSALSVGVALDVVAARPLAGGQAATGVPLGPRHEAWFELPISPTEFWFELAARGRGFDGGGVLSVDLFDPAEGGVLFQGYYPGAGLAPFDPAGETHGQFFPDPLTQHAWLARVGGLPDPPDGASVDITYARRDHTVLAKPAPGAPVVLPGETIAAGQTRRYFVPVRPGDTIQVKVTPTGFDARLHDVGGQETGSDYDDAGVGGVESYRTTTASFEPAWVAFTVDGSGAGTFRAEVEASAPGYTVARGTLAFADACTGGGATVVMHAGPFTGPDAKDEGLSDLITLPFPFAIFADPAIASVQVSTNGWMTFTDAAGDVTEPDNLTMPLSDGVDRAFAPYWDDLRDVTICQKADAANFTLQWTGAVASSLTRRVQVQLRLHADGSADFIYGPGHTADGATATIGAEDAFASQAVLIGFDKRGSVGPSTSITLTPRP